MEVLVESKRNFDHTKFYVLETNHKNLLSGETALQLGLLTLNTTQSAYFTHVEKIKTL